MGVENVGSGNVAGVRKLVENAAALGMSAAQLRELLKGVDLNLTSLFGIKKSDEPVKALFSDAADQLSRVVDKSPPATQTTGSPDPKPVTVVEDPVAALAKKVADAKAQNSVTRTDLDAQKKSLETRLPDFLVGTQVATAAGAVRELLNPVTAGQTNNVRKAVDLFRLELSEKDNLKGVYGQIMLTSQGIRLHTKERSYTGYESMSAPTPEQLQSLLTRAGITFESLALKVSDTITALGNGSKVPTTFITQLDQDRLVPDPFRKPFDVALGKADIKAKVKDVEAGKWDIGATQGKERAAAAKDLVASWSPDAMSGADFRLLASALLDQLNQNLVAGQDKVASIFPGDAVEICKALVTQAEHHGLERDDLRSMRNGIEKLTSLMTERNARCPDGTLVSADASAAALSKLWHDVR